MGKAAFTPGPWHFKPGNVPGFKTGSGNPGIYAPARQSDDHFILMIADLETNVPAREIEANAHLIAVAPELYDALSAAPNPSKYHGQNGFEEARFFADYEEFMATRRAVLARAEGRASLPPEQR